MRPLKTHFAFLSIVMLGSVLARAAVSDAQVEGAIGASDDFASHKQFLLQRQPNW